MKLHTYFMCAASMLLLDSGLRDGNGCCCYLAGGICFTSQHKFPRRTSSSSIFS
jgi:hypothetical protein